ncbi:uncharacterized protein [Battus philenor]|uniref:uncharacterized protein n=1 Tax=Battus philenor TaxID=42288 RepID=UPI0035D08AFB
MALLKIAPVFILAICCVIAEKKIELQDIEEDNLKSEKEFNYEIEEPQSDDREASDEAPLEYLKSGVLRYFRGPSPTQGPQQQRYTQQYAVTEPQERSVTPAPQYGPPEAQQAMVNYLKNVPMQVYLIPQYDESSRTHTEARYQGQVVNQFNYSTPDLEQTLHNYVDVQSYGAPTATPHMQEYQSPLTYESVSVQPNAATTIAPLVSYQVPVIQYQTALVPPPTLPASIQQHYTKLFYPNVQYNQGQFENVQENGIKSQNYYSAQREVPSVKSQVQEITRHYNSRKPYREDYTKSNPVLPHPSPMLLKAPPPHLAHIPKALPMHRPWSKPVYNNGGFGAASSATKPFELYGPPPKTRPTSLLDSYVPSHVQVEYLKRGIIKDPLVAYEALSRGKFMSPLSPASGHYESGFLPNQAFHTAIGRSFYGHYKRSPNMPVKLSN